MQELRSQKISPCAAGIPTSSTVLPEDLGAILASHPFIHTAEGVLFQRVAAGACEAVGLPVRRARERDLRAKMAGEAGRALDALRKSLGPPWGADQKAATAAALWALGRI